MVNKQYAEPVRKSQNLHIEAPLVLTHPDQIGDYVHGISKERFREADMVVQTFLFRLTRFYAENILSGSVDDPLLDLVFPSTEELLDGEELWDTTPSQYSASDSPFWVQKYQYQGLIRLTTACSGLCRFCYVKKRNANPVAMSIADVNRLFDDLEKKGEYLREIILSGGDPLCAPSDVLDAIADRMVRLRAMPGRENTYINIHTRELVWYLIRFVQRRSAMTALAKLRPKTYVINVLHPREVTPEFVEACAVISELSGPKARPALLCQHPLFKGVNDTVEVLEELYIKLMEISPPVLPYYLVHPFYNGTLPKHRMSILDSQNIIRELQRCPGCMSPQLVVPTPWGKCHIGAYDKLAKSGDRYVITTKDGKEVLLP